MPFVVERTFIKPDGVSWVFESNPDLTESRITESNKQKELNPNHGIISTEFIEVDKNTRIMKQIFETEEASYAWQEWRITSLPHQLAYQYNLENNISSTSRSYEI